MTFVLFRIGLEGMRFVFDISAFFLNYCKKHLISLIRKKLVP